MNKVIRRVELEDALLEFGSVSIDLAPYATTGLRMVTIGPSGIGKTNAGLVVAEQLAEQGWVSVLVDPEGELASMYGKPVSGIDALQERLAVRDQQIVVVEAADATEFIPYGRAILEASDQHRKPIFLMIDEGQLFSTTKKRTGDAGAAAVLVNEFADRGRKRALDLFMTATRFTGSLHRTIFSHKNLTLIGCQEDPAAWAALAPQFRASRIGYAELASLAPGEFFCFSRSGVDKVRMPMSRELAKVAPKAQAAVQKLPTTFSQWDRAMRGIPKRRLQALTDPVVKLMGAVVGLTTQQLLAGRSALRDELGGRG